MAVVSLIRFQNIDMTQLADSEYRNTFKMLFEQELASAADVPAQYAEIQEFISGSVLVCVDTCLL